MTHSENVQYIMEFEDAFDSDFCKSVRLDRESAGLPPYEDIVFWKDKDIYKEWAYLMDDLDSRAKPFIETYLDQFSNTAFYHNLNCDGFGINRQPPGGYDRFHYDTNIVINESKMYVRPFVALIYLNDGFSGGQLIFPSQRRVIEPKMGKLVFFPCSYMYPHKVAGISEDDRYVVRLNYSFKNGVIDTDLDYWDFTKNGVQK